MFFYYHFENYNYSFYCNDYRYLCRYYFSHYQILEKKVLSVINNITKEFIEKMHKLLGNEAEEFFSSLEKPSQKGITLNTSRMSKELFEKPFDDEIIDRINKLK